MMTKISDHDAYAAYISTETGVDDGVRLSRRRGLVDDEIQRFGETSVNRPCRLLLPLFGRGKVTSSCAYYRCKHDEYRVY